MQIYNSLDEVVEAGTIAPDSILNADCLEAMKFIPDKSIDCIICDLPYGVTACKWDIVIPFDLLWEQYKRIIKPNGAIVLFGSQPFTSALVMSNPKWFKYEWIWEKQRVTNFVNAKKQPLRNLEYCLIFSEKRTNYYPQNLKRIHCIKTNGVSVGGESLRQNVIQSANKGSLRTKGALYIQEFTGYPRQILKNIGENTKQHPTQKPVKLIEYLAKTYTLENEIILDNTAGSGTLAIAAINTNRRYICIEKDPDYFEVMRNRIENHDPNALVTPKKARKPKAIIEGQLALFG